MVYVDTTFDPDPATGHDGTIARQSASEVLTGILANEGADLSAHETLERAQRQAQDFGVLGAEYETLARAAQQQRWDELLGRSGLEPRRLEQVRQSPAYGPLLATLRMPKRAGSTWSGPSPFSWKPDRSMTPKTSRRSSAAGSNAGDRPPDWRGERAPISSQG